MSRPRYAVVGSGVSGLVAAYVLSRAGSVTVYEADDRAGGHAHTHEVTLPDGLVVPVDSGFIVHNDRTYPTLRRLFAELDVATQPAPVSRRLASMASANAGQPRICSVGSFAAARNGWSAWA